MELAVPDSKAKGAPPVPVSMGLAASACGASRLLKKEFWERPSLATGCPGNPILALGCPGNPIQTPASSAHPTQASASEEVLARAHSNCPPRSASLGNL